MNDQEYISHLKSHIRSQDSLLAKQAEQLRIQAGKIEQLEKKVEQLLFMFQKQGGKKTVRTPTMLHQKIYLWPRIKASESLVHGKLGGSLVTRVILIRWK